MTAPFVPLSSLVQQLPDFDPRQVPVVGTDAGLPAVAGTALTPQALRQRFAAPPVWTPEIARELAYLDRAPMRAAVLLPIVLHQRPTLLLTQRTEQMPTHSGQIAFPGGRADAHDANAAATALREAHEEVGLALDRVEVLGELPLYITGSAFLITPVVALVRPGAALVPDPREVADVFEVPLDYLLDPAHHQRQRLQWQGQSREWYSMPYQDGEKTRFIWGATAAMLRNFYRFMIA